MIPSQSGQIDRVSGAPGGHGETEILAGQAAEIGGAAYRVQPHSWAPQADHPVHYASGFVLARNSKYYSQADFAAFEASLPPLKDEGSFNAADDASMVAREMRPRQAEQVGFEGGPGGHRVNVLNQNSRDGSTGGPPAPRFLRGSRTGR